MAYKNQNKKIPAIQGSKKSWADAVKEKSASNPRTEPRTAIASALAKKDNPDYEKCRFCSNILHMNVVSACDCKGNNDYHRKSNNDWLEYGWAGADLGDGWYGCGGKIVDRSSTGRPINRIITITIEENKEDEEA